MTAVAWPTGRSSRWSTSTGLNLRQIGQRFFDHGHSFPPRLLLTVITGICRGLHAAHELRDRRGPFNFLHRDLSPENIMVARGGPPSSSTSAPRSAATVPRAQAALRGPVLRYVAPERINGTSEDRRGDVYSLGVVLYEYLTGTPPFAGDDDPATAALILPGQLRPPQDLVPQLLPELARITCKALAPAPDDRYATAAALASDLLPLLESRDLQPSPDESRRLLRLALAPGRNARPRADHDGPGRRQQDRRDGSGGAASGPSANPRRSHGGAPARRRTN